MSVTHPEAGLAPAPRTDFAAQHPQFAPFLLAVAIFVVSVVVALGFAGLPG